jgi:hypothetical protein
VLIPPGPDEPFARLASLRDTCSRLLDRTQRHERGPLCPAYSGQARDVDALVAPITLQRLEISAVARASHTRTRPSKPPLTRRRPSADNAPPCIAPIWDCAVARARPVLTYHSRAEPISPPLATSSPVEEIAVQCFTTVVTGRARCRRAAGSSR